MDIGDKLRRARERTGMTQAQVAELLHVTRQTVSGYERGRTEPDINTLEQMASLYGTAMEELIHGRGEAAVCRLSRAAKAVLACYLAALMLLSGARWCTNRWFTPAGLENGKVQVTGENRELLENRMALVNIRENAEATVNVVFDLALLALVYFDSSTKYGWRFRPRALLLLTLAAGSIAVTLPWGIFDKLHGIADYRISTYDAIASGGVALIADVCVAVFRKVYKRKKAI